MWCRIRSVAIASAFAIAGVAALPTGGVHAGNLLPIAYITPRPNSSGVVPCEPGKDKTFSGEESYSSWLSMDFHWQWPGGEARGRDLFDVAVPCPTSGEIELSLTVNNGFGTSVDTVRLAADGAPKAVISWNGEPQDFERFVAVGATLVFSGAASTDPENKPLKYEWTDPIDPISGNPNASSISVTCDAERDIELILTVTDEAGLKSQRPLSVRCFKGVEARFSPAPTDDGTRTRVPLGAEITFDTAASKYSWFEWRTTGVPGVASRNRTYTRTFDKVGNYGVELKETSPFGEYKRWAGYTVVAPPTAAVTPAPPKPTDRMTVVAGSTISFDGTGSMSPSGAPLTYEWRTTGKSGVVSDGTSYSRSFDTPGNFGVELTVTDDLGQSSKRWVGLTVMPSKAPVVSVTPAPADPKSRMTVELGKTITFDGRASTDPDGGAVTYVWRTTGVPGVAATTSTYARRFDKVGNFGVELTVTDDEGQTAKRWVGITVTG